MTTLFEPMPLPPEVIRESLDLLTEEEFASALGVTTNTLMTWRSRREGPEYTKLGKTVFYRREDVRTWIAKNRVSLTEA